MEKWKSNMILPRYLFYLTNLFGFILCKDSFYPEYEHYYDGMDSRQKLGFKLFVRSYRKYNRTINHIPKDKLATMDEYLDVSGRGTMIENVLYDTLKEKYDREKASEKYPHPDDQEMYMAVRKYTPLLNSSEISNWIHNVNSRYRNIMNITEPSTLSTKKLPTTSGKSTKYRTRFTIFKPGQDPFGSLIGDDYYQEKTPSKQNYPKFKKRTIEPIYDNVERYYISSTKKVFNETHLDEGRENPAEAMVREYFKSHSITYKPNGGFQTCPTVSPAEQEKLIKQFEEMLKVPDMRLEEIFRNYENKSIYNSSYIDEYIRANNLSTIVVSDLSMLDNITLSTIENCIDERTTHTAQELKTKSPVSSLGQNEVEREDSFLWNITTVTTQRTTFETTSVNRLMTNENQIKKKIEEDKHLENSFQSFLNNNTLRELLNTLGESTMTKEISLSGETTPHPAFNSSLYRYIEDKFEEFQTACNGNLKDELGISDEKIKLDENDEEQRERYYNQKELFNKIIFQNTAELLGYKHIDRLYPSFEETQKIQESTKKTERSVNAITTLDPIENNVNKDNEVKETSIRKTEPTRVSTTEDSEDASIEVTECATFANKSLFYKQRYKKRHRKSHRSHKKRRHHHNYRNPNYMPPNPYHHYNPYYPPPPYPYPPQFYPQPPPPPPPQHPHFYHFTSSNWVDNQPDSMALRTTDDQFQLYLKLKDIFQPVDKALNGKKQYARVWYLPTILLNILYFAIRTI